MPLNDGTRQGVRAPREPPYLRCTKCGYVNYRQRWFERGGTCPSGACDGGQADTRVATLAEFATRRGLQGWD